MAKLLLYGSSQLANWLEELPTSKTWKDNIFAILSALYAVVAAVAFINLSFLVLAFFMAESALHLRRSDRNSIQLIRIQRRVPEYGWTTQKVFHLLNFLVTGVRAGVFLFYEDVSQLEPRIFELVLLDLPGLLFFTTYSLLVLFWAEIYYQARSLPTDGLRPLFLILNAVLYIVQICLWIFFWRSPDAVLMFFSNIFIAAWSLCAASGFLIYGGRLFIMLQRFPAESRGRQKKLQEIGLVTTVCFSCFLIRCLMILSSAFLKSAEIDPLKRPLITSVYYLLVEIIPATLVLFILRKLPRPSVHVDRPGSSGGRDDHSSFMASA